MGENREERNRVFGIPIGTGPHDRQGEEQQRVMGFPVGAFDGEPRWAPFPGPSDPGL